MLDFGEIYWLKKLSGKSFENHYAVVLGVDAPNNLVFFQTFTSQLDQVLHFPSSKRAPYIDVDTVGFLNYRKYRALISKDTGIILWHGIAKENQAVFKSNVTMKRYIHRGKLLKHNAQHLLVAMKSATAYKLSTSERSVMMAHYKTY